MKNSSLANSYYENTLIHRSQDDAFFKKIQKFLNIYVLFLPLGIVKVGGISVTFFIFLAIVYFFFKKGKKLFRLKDLIDYILVLFFILLTLSILFSEETFRELGIDSDAKVIVRLIYWMSLALFIKTWAHRFDFFQLAKYIFFGTISTIIFYYTLNVSLKILTQNSFAYVLVVSIPFAMYYIFNRFSLIIVLSASALFFYFALLTTSRAGAFIVFMQLIILLFTAKYIRKKTLMFFSLILFPLLVLLYLSFDTYRNDLANTIEPYSPDLSDLIREGDDRLKIDKSWLERKQMIVKGKIIFDEHPFFGIGFAHFKYYSVDMQLISPYLSKSMFFYNRLSAHNTYIQILAGAGIFALIIFLFIILFVLKKGMTFLLSFKFKPEIFIFVSFLGMIIYFYVISAGLGAITWFVMGYGVSLTTRKNHTLKIESNS